MKNILILAVLFGVTILFSGCLQQAPEETPTQETPTVPEDGETPVEETEVTETPTEPKTITVNITSDGYSPDTITINSGDTINFVNVNDGPHWVASTPHPIHTDTPGFDSRKALQQGESYSFIFTAKGTFGCHDHLEPATRCTIIVQ